MENIGLEFCFLTTKQKKKTPNLEKQNQDYIKKYELGQII